MSMSKLLKEFIETFLETGLARVPQQLVSTEDEQADNGEEEEGVNEFSGAGGAAGYTLPLGMDPDSAGRKKNSLR